MRRGNKGASSSVFNGPAFLILVVVVLVVFHTVSRTPAADESHERNTPNVATLRDSGSKSVNIKLQQEQLEKARAQHDVIIREEFESRKGKSIPTMYDLSRISNPVAELVADADMVQIHHGIYKVRCQSLQDGKGDLVFAFKTECRPAAKWHGQQGWSEVAVYHFTQLFFGGHHAQDEDGILLSSMNLATAPPARGLVVRISQTLLKNVVHKDQCGVLTAAQRKGLHVPEEEGDVALIGVALTWQPRHDDSALPDKSYRQYFLPPSSSDASATLLSAAKREEISQISDVSLMDFLLGNDDREEKNWFFDDEKKYVMMDNGWAFAGRNYVGSVCDGGNNSSAKKNKKGNSLAKCPPLFRRLDNPTCTSVVNCRFRQATIGHLHVFLDEWLENRRDVRTHWVDLMEKDPLIRFLIDSYGDVNKVKRSGGDVLIYNEGLARYIQQCPGVQKDDVEVSGKGMSPKLIGFLVEGLTRRMNTLRLHVKECVDTYGEAYVFGG